MSTRITFIRHLQQTSHRVVDAPIITQQRIHHSTTDYDIVICSPYLRTRQTAEMYDCQELTVDIRICEYQGHKALKTFKLDQSTLSYATQHSPIPNSSETWNECAKRIDLFLDFVLELEGNILVVTHGIVVNYASEKLLGKRKYPKGRDVPYGKDLLLGLVNKTYCCVAARDQYVIIYYSVAP